MDGGRVTGIAALLAAQHRQFTRQRLRVRAQLGDVSLLRRDPLALRHDLPRLLAHQLIPGSARRVLRPQWWQIGNNPRSPEPTLRNLRDTRGRLWKDHRQPVTAGHQRTGQAPGNAYPLRNGTTPIVRDASSLDLRTWS